MLRRAAHHQPVSPETGLGGFASDERCVFGKVGRRDNWGAACSNASCGGFERRFAQGEYLMTLHAEEEMEADHLTIFDVESAVLSGRVVERQRDRGTREAKYLVRGRGLDDEAVVVVAKVSPTGKMVIVTAYRE